MCKECGCENHKQETPKRTRIDKSLNEINDTLAEQISEFLKKNQIFCINIMGSPGSGKTTVIEQISEFLKSDEIAVIQGDLESDIDKKRIEKRHIESYQINTHSGCHLNAHMINQALPNIKLDGKKYLVIENVGNLVCPAGVKIGQHMNVLVSSVTEGEDKPAKYPFIFMDAQMVILSKTDLSGVIEFNEINYINEIKNINPKCRIIRASLKNLKSFKETAAYIKHQRNHFFDVFHDHN
ncbi:hydrogenase nickel incorporation protein HypB [Candidatus Woesearchaeota archaeon]|nr:hydrogenase nickel incorporation protein HypB [Candidatus Woesearchaeota archaeon]